MSDDFKRLTAFKISINSIMNSDFVEEEGEADYLTCRKLKVSRVRVIATVVSKRVNEERTYAYLVLDDGSETIRVKAWKEQVELLEKPLIGDIVEIVGRVREWEGERYLTCEIIKVITNPNHWLLHKFELLMLGEKVERIEEKEEKGISTSVEAEGNKVNLEDEILKIIKGNDIGKGTSLSLIVKKLKLSNKEVEEVLKTLLIDGLIYEPKKHHYKVLELEEG